MKKFTQCEGECGQYYPIYLCEEVFITNKGSMIWCKKCISKTLKKIIKKDTPKLD